MKRIAAIAAVAATLASAAVAAEPARVADLAWMAGTWVSQDDGKTVRETWLPPVDGAIGGVGQTSRPGKPSSFEFMTITTEAAGVTFTAYVNGQPATPFVLKPGPAGQAVFENLGHDFPQRIIYRQCDQDLCARIEGMMDGKLQGMEWRYKRAG